MNRTIQDIKLDIVTPTTAENLEHQHAQWREDCRLLIERWDTLYRLHQDTKRELAVAEIAILRFEASEANRKVAEAARALEESDRAEA